MICYDIANIFPSLSFAFQFWISFWYTENFYIHLLIPSFETSSFGFIMSTLITQIKGKFKSSLHKLTIKLILLEHMCSVKQEIRTKRRPASLPCGHGWVETPFILQSGCGRALSSQLHSSVSSSWVSHIWWLWFLLRSSLQKTSCDFIIHMGWKPFKSLSVRALW